MIALFYSDQDTIRISDPIYDADPIYDVSRIPLFLGISGTQLQTARFEAFHAVTFSAAIPKPSHSETCTGSLSNLLG